ncbi:uncharacterized protein [Diabrotica undecimpunctata]|uniref:uncharacterized protein n=1 Tax=Diabrotica undecimpunctata TaxID=50387 RepID=UPI003B63A0A6
MTSTGKKRLTILQVNVGRAKTAHDLLLAKALALNADLIIVPEPNKNIVKKNGWITDTRSDVAIYINNKNMHINKVKRREGYLKINIDNLAIIACYISSNINIEHYERQVENIIDMSQNERDFIVAGDVNAKSILWGSPHNDRRGEIWNEWISSADIVVLNNGEPTFVRGESKSHIDVTLASKNVAKKISGWDVLGENLFTHHRYIFYEIGVKVTHKGRQKNEFNKEKFKRNK